MTQVPAHEVATVHLLRHGEVDNPRGVLYGRLPGYHLSALGLAMAHRSAQYLSEVPFSYLVSSPLERAQETIAPIAASRPNLTIQLDERVIEAASAFEGQVFGARNEALRRPAGWWKLRNPIKPSWGEPFKDVAARMREAIQDAAAQVGPGGHALIVSHQLPIWMARLSAEGRVLVHDPRRRQCTLASITSIRLLDGQIQGIDYAEPAKDLIPVKDRSKNFSSGGASESVGV
jgi:broad specificity phosphatase PhoE